MLIIARWLAIKERALKRLRPCPSLRIQLEGNLEKRKLKSVEANRSIFEND